MRRPKFVENLSPEAEHELEERYRHTPDPGERTRCQIILLSASGYKAADIAQIVPPLSPKVLNEAKKRGEIVLNVSSGLQPEAAHRKLR